MYRQTEGLSIQFAMCLECALLCCLYLCIVLYSGNKCGTLRMQVVDLLIAMANAAAHSPRANLILDPFPSVVDPADHDRLAMDPKVGTALYLALCTLYLVPWSLVLPQLCCVCLCGCTTFLQQERSSCTLV